MKEGKRQQAMKPINTFEGRLLQARTGHQNVLLIKWLLFAVSVTLLLIYLLTPIRDMMFVS